MTVFQKLLWIPVVLAMLGTLAASGWSLSHPVEPLPKINPLGDWTLTDPSGNAFSSAQLAGKVWIAGFVYTYCSGPCPVMSFQMQKLRDELAAERDFRLVTFSVDPKQDKPPRMKAYAEQWGADPSRWNMLTGEGVLPLSWDKFKLQTAPEDGGGILHSTKLVLVDRTGTVRGYYTAIDEERENDLYPRADLSALVRDIRRLVREPESLFSVRTLPRVNAALNGLCAMLLCLGLLFIKMRRIGAHKATMVSALAVSVVFLASYLTYHAAVGSVRFTLGGWIRPVYFGILITHTVLAAAIVPMALTTVWVAWKERYPAHVRIARWTLPLWLYVSITGILVYTLLYAI